MTFEIGVVVVLKSGGPPLTVEVARDNYHDNIDGSLSFDTVVSVAWLSAGKLQRASLDSRMLTPRETTSEFGATALATTLERQRWAPLVGLLLDQLGDQNGLNTSMLRAMCDSPETGRTSAAEGS